MPGLRAHFLFLLMLWAVLGIAARRAHADSAARSSRERVVLFPAAQEIVGSEGSAVVVVQLPAGLSASDPAILHLWTEVGKDAVLAESTLSIELDDAPIYSSFLHRKQAIAEITVPLPVTPSGFHVLRIRSRLVSALDPCLTKQRSLLWLRLLSESSLVHVRPLVVSAPDSVSALVSGWRDARAGVRLVTRESVTPAQLPVVLAADGFLRSLGARPKTEGDDLPQLVLHIDPREREQEILPKGARLLSDRQTLHIIARDTDSLIEQLLALRTTARWESCITAQCDFAAVASHQGNRSVDAQSGRRSSALVRSVSALGFPSGYVAKGEGQHILSFSWPRPSHYELKQWPELRLRISRSNHPALDRRQSSIEVRLQGRPIATFSLDAAGTAQKPMILSAQIPPSFFSESVLSFEIVTSLLGSAVPPRCLLEPTALWAVIEEDSGLYVPRTELSYPSSLASFAAQAEQSALRLVIPSRLSRRLLPLLGAILYPLDKGQRWELVESILDCGPLCVVVTDKARQSVSPDAHSAGTVIAIEQSPKARQLRLMIYLQESADVQAETESPDLSSIITTRAELTQTGWQPMGETGKIGKPLHVLIPQLPVDGEPIDSQQQTERKLVDGLWMMVLLLAALLGWLFVRTHRRSQLHGART